MLMITSSAHERKSKTILYVYLVKTSVCAKRSSSFKAAAATLLHVFGHKLYVYIINAHAIVIYIYFFFLSKLSYLLIVYRIKCCT